MFKMRSVQPTQLNRVDHLQNLDLGEVLVSPGNHEEVDSSVNRSFPD